METESQNGILDYNAPPPQPVGIYGWRKRCLYAFVLALMVVVIINLALTVWILRVLDFSLDGMGKLKIAPKGFELNGEAEFLKPVYANRIKSEQGKSLYVQSNKAVELLSTDKKNKAATSKLVIGKENIEATCDSFLVQDMKGNMNMMLKDKKVYLGTGDVSFPGEIKFSSSISTPTVRSPEEEPLRIKSETSKVQISGMGGVSMLADVGDVTLEAADNVYISSTTGALHFDSHHVKITGVPRADSSSLSSFNPLTSSSASSSSSSQDVYQLCLCENGRAFLGLPTGVCRASSDICGP